MPFDRFYEEMISRFTRELVEKVGAERVEEIYESGNDPIGDAIPEVIEETTGALVEALKKQMPGMVAGRRSNFVSYNELIASYWGRAFDLLEAVIQVAYETGEDFLVSYAEEAEKEQDLVFYVLTRPQVRASRISEEFPEGGVAVFLVIDGDAADALGGDCDVLVDPSAARCLTQIPCRGSRLLDLISERSVRLETLGEHAAQHG